MAEDKVVYEIQKRTDEKIVFSLAEFKGKKYAHVRTWINDPKGTGDYAWVRTQKGICIPIELVDELGKGASALALAVDGGEKD